MANAIPGKAFGLRFKDVYFECQTDLSFDATVDTNTEANCKPNPTEAWQDVRFATPTVSGGSWTASVTAKAVDAIVDNQVTALNDIKLGARGDLEIFTNTESNNSPIANEFVVSGEAILTGFSLSAPEAGEATYDLTFTGYGDYTVVASPVTT